jgi:hypothetical protein
LSFFQTLETQTFQRRFSRVTDARFDFALAIWILNATLHGHRAVVREHIAIEIEGGIVDVGDEHALAQIIENHDASGSAQSAEGALVQLGPDASAGAERQQAN